MPRLTSQPRRAREATDDRPGIRQTSDGWFEPNPSFENKFFGEAEDPSLYQ